MAAAASAVAETTPPAVPSKLQQLKENSRPWIEKYRPKSLKDLIAHTDIISTINRLMEAKRLPHLLFYGPPGTGKTSTILACAKQMFGSNLSAMVLELNASDDRGIGVVRNQIKNFAGTKKLFSTGVKLVILDEADALTKDAQFALRRVIEKYTKNTRFCLICNYVSKIIPALQSRCMRFRFGLLKTSEMESKLLEIAKAEGCNVTPDGVKAMLTLSKGDMRRALNVLQAAHMAYPVINEKNVYFCTGKPLPADIKYIADSLLNDTYQESFNKIRKLQTERGLALTDVITEITDFLMRMKLPAVVKTYLLSHLSEFEYNLASASSESIQLGALVGAFCCARHILTQRAAKEQKA